MIEKTVKGENMLNRIGAGKTNIIKHKAKCDIWFLFLLRKGFLRYRYNHYCPNVS